MTTNGGYLLSVLCISRVGLSSLSFLATLSGLAHSLGAEFVVAADGVEALRRLSTQDEILARVVCVQSKGWLESVHDEAVRQCRGEYVLRVDDDESCSEAMVRWLAARRYLVHDHWKFPRFHLWGSERQIMVTPHLLPDYQTRLSVKEKALGRTSVHCGSPYGGGEEAPVALLHHKFLVKSYEERLRIAQVYDSYVQGYGTGSMLPFSLPEDAYDSFVVQACGDGTYPYEPTWCRDVNTYKHLRA